MLGSLLNNEGVIKKGVRILELTIIVVVLSLVLYFTLKSFFGGKNFLKDTEASVKTLEKKIDSIHQDQSFLLSRMYEMEQKQLIFNEEIGRNNMLIEKQSIELSKLKKIYNEKIRTVDNYSYSQLDSFFAERYGRFYTK